MVHKLDIAGEHYTIDANLRKYVNRKLGRIDKYLSRHCRESAHMEVRMKEHLSNGKKQCIAQLTLHLPKETINLKESTLNMYAAIDILQAKLKQQVQRYKELHADGKLRRRLFSRRSGDMLA